MKKQLKSFGIRCLALLVFFCILAAMILYERGVYDISFVERRKPYAIDSEGTAERDTTDLPHGDTTAPGTESTGTDTEPDTTHRQYTDEELLAMILSLPEAEAKGLSLSGNRFGRNSSLARITLDPITAKQPFSLRTETVTENNLVQNADKLYVTKKITTEKDVPVIRLYFGSLLVDNGKNVALLNGRGETLADNFKGELTYSRSVNGYGVVKIDGAYFEIDPVKGLVAVNAKKIDTKALYFDYPADYAVSPEGAPVPYSETVTLYTETKLKKQTDPPVTEPDDTGSENSDSETGEESGDPQDTESGAGSESVPADTGDVLLAPEAVRLQALLEDGSGEESGSDALPEDTGKESEDGESSEEDSAEASGEESSDTPSSDTEEELPAGVVKIDGKYYTTKRAVRWGYKDAAGKTVIEPKYLEAYTFTADGLAAVITEENKLIFIDTKGTPKVYFDSELVHYPENVKMTMIQSYRPAYYEDSRSYGMYYFDGGYVMARYCWHSVASTNRIYENELRLVNTMGYSLKLPEGYELINYSEGILLIRTENGYIFTDTSLSLLTDTAYDSALPMTQGLSVVGKAQGDSVRYGVIDRSGNTVLPLIYDYVSPVSAGRIAAYSTERGWELFCVVE